MFEILVCHNPYFNRWFSAICFCSKKGYCNMSHNPYFNRWFSAIQYAFCYVETNTLVTILILIDGFLQ